MKVKILACSFTYPLNFQTTSRYNSSRNISFKALPTNQSYAASYVKESAGKLIRGPKLSFKNILELKEEGVTLIIDFRSRTFIGSRTLEQIFSWIVGIKHKNIPHQFKTSKLPAKEKFLEIAKLIKENKGKTYLHCNTGRHRTSLFVAAYNIINNGKPFEKAFNEDILNHNYISREFKPVPEILNFSDIIKAREAKRNNKMLSFSLKALELFKKMFGDKPCG